MNKILLHTTVLFASMLLAAAASQATTVYGSAYATAEVRSKLYSLDTTTGAATLIGGDAIAFFPGLAFSATGNLYGSGSNLYSINTSTGFATTIGALPELIVSIAFDQHGALWGVGNGTATLWRLDPSTGQSQGAGFLTGLQPGGLRSIAFSPTGTLYGIGQGVLYTINPSTFAATVQAPVTPCCSVSGLTFSQEGQLYTAYTPTTGGPSALSTVNLLTGNLTSLGPSSPTPPVIRFDGLAAPIPEPSTVALLALGIACLAIRRLRADA